MTTSERIIDTWTILYESPLGRIYNGKLTVTNQRLLYDVKLGFSTKELQENNLIKKWGTEDYIVIHKDRIKSVVVSKKVFSKKVILTLDNNTIHTFNNGVFSIEPLANALRVF